jgi:hypothetical protein
VNSYKNPTKDHSIHSENCTEENFAFLNNAKAMGHDFRRSYDDQENIEYNVPSSTLQKAKSTHISLSQTGMGKVKSSNGLDGVMENRSTSRSKTRNV